MFQTIFVLPAPDAEANDTAVLAATTPAAAVGGYDQYRALYDYEVNPNPVLRPVQEVLSTFHSILTI